MSNTKYLMTEARASANKWATVKQAADLLGAVVAEMVQAVAEADEVKLLRHKRKELENCYNSQFIPESLEIVRHEYSGYKLADSFREILHWFELMQGATTFERWSVYRKHFLVRRSYFHNHLASCTSEASKYHQHFDNLHMQYKADIVKENKKRTPPVAVRKAVRKAAIIDRTNKMVHTKYVHDTAKSYYVTAQTPKAVLYGRLRVLTRYSSDKLQYALASASRLCNDMAKVDGRYSTVYLLTTAQDVHKLYADAKPVFLARLP